MFLDDNKQTEEALKHIYTALIANQDIEISVDLPLQRLRALDDSDLSSLDDEDDQSLDLLSPRNSGAPDAMAKQPSSSRQKANDDQDAMLQKVEGDGSLGEDHEAAAAAKPAEEAADEEEQPKRHVVPGICRLKIFRTCRLMCFRDPSKPKLTLTQIFCPTFLAARAQATRFKISWSLLVDSEKKIQMQIFVIVIAMMVLFFLLALVVPFVFAVMLSKEVKSVADGSKMPLIPAFGAYGAFLALSTLAEGAIPALLRRTLGPETGATHVFCNRYLMTKWCQGQLANLATFTHVCFVASVIA